MNSFENKIIQTSEVNFVKELSVIKSKHKTLEVEINGAEIKSWTDYIKIIEKNFCFPTSCVDSMDRYLDWIRDLSWLDDEAVIILIKNSKLFLNQDPKLRDEILEDLKEVVLPFWKSEIHEVVVGGKSKLFCVYLV